MNTIGFRNTLNPAVALSIGTILFVVASQGALGANTLEQSSRVLGKVSLSTTPSALLKNVALTFVFSRSAEVKEIFEASIGKDSAKLAMLPEEIRVRITAARPSVPIKISIRLPLGISEPKLMALVFYDGESEAYDFFEEVPSSFNSQTRELIADITPKLFTGPAKDSKSYDATLVVAAPKK